MSNTPTSRPRETYVPLTEELIERQRKAIQAYFAGDGLVGDLDLTDVLTALDMASNCLLYAEEIQRLRGDGRVVSETECMDAAGQPKIEATVLERRAVEALNEVKAWRDSDGNEPFPQSTRERVEEAIMMYELRRVQRPNSCPHSAPFVYCKVCKVNPCPLGLHEKGARGDD